MDNPIDEQRRKIPMKKRSEERKEKSKTYIDRKGKSP
jgi:hypothetical protein